MFNKLVKVTGLAGILCVSNLYAGCICEGFQVKIKNNLQDDIEVTQLMIEGGQFDPHGTPIISKKSEGAFTLTQVRPGPMLATVAVESKSTPKKAFEIKFTLEDKNVVCIHDHISQVGNVNIDKTRKIGEVVYTID